MKYIIFQSDLGQHLPFIFPESVNHIDQSMSILKSFRAARKLIPIPVSDGFVEFTNGVTTYGMSESMNLQGDHPTDAGIIGLGSSVAFLPREMIKSV